MGIFRKSYCYCGSGLEQGFCSHRGALAEGEVSSNGRRVSGGSKLSRAANGTPPAGKRKGK